MRSATEPGQIIILNGGPTAGKTSIAKAIQQLFSDPYLLFGTDLMIQISPPQAFGTEEGMKSVPVPDTDPPENVMESGPFGDSIVAGLHAALVAFSEIGHCVVADHMLAHERWLRDCVRQLAHLPVLLVGVRCPFDVIIERRRERDDHITRYLNELRTERGEMLAFESQTASDRWWHREVHVPGIYDLEVDTSLLSPDECALAIRERLEHGPPPAAIQTLKEELGV